jgi:predicted DNA-binding transcriptional regulator AlpA
MTTRLLSTRQVAEMVGVTTKTLLSWVRAGKFPRPLQIGMRKLLWSPEAVQHALAAQPIGKADLADTARVTSGSK